MYSEPTISPNFVVRQKRKFFRHPLVIGGIASIIFIALFGFVTLLSGGSPSNDDTPVDSASVSVRIVEETPEVESVQPTISRIQPTPIAVINVSQPIPDEETSQALDPETTCNIRPTGDVNVNIRSGPDLQFTLISVLSARQTAPAISVSDNRWFEIRNHDGTIGWVGGSVVDEFGECETLPVVKTPVCDVKNTTGNRVNIRAQANTNSRVVRTLAVDDILMADGQTADGWYRILLTGELGWIYRDVVQLGDACSNIPLISANEPTPVPAVNTSLVFNEEDCVIESFTGNSIDLYKRPDLTSSVVAKLNKAMKASRISSNGWYEIEGFGWAFAGDVVTQGLCRLLPTVDAEDVR